MADETNSSDELRIKLARVAHAFRPGAPVDTRDLFAGRTEQMNAMIQSIAEPFMHCIVFGERGVGKTSLVTVVGSALPHVFKALGIEKGVHVVRENCAEADTFITLWRRAMAKCPVALVSRGTGFAADHSINITSGNALLPESDFGPGDIVGALKSAREHIIFIFDEFDRVSDRSVANPMADLLKALSDHHVGATIVLVGVGDSVTEIIAAHRSVERCTRQIHMPRMTNAELFEILEKGSKICKVTFETQSAGIIVNLARGFPHYAHLLASEASKVAILRRGQEVSREHLALSLDSALARSQRSLADSYVQATQSPRRDAIHKEVLLSCALARTDEQGYFRPSDLKAGMSQLLHRSGVLTSSFTNHLTDFSGEARGSILKKIGKPRSFRFRFSDPLMIPYVLVRGLLANMITPEELGAPSPPSHDPEPATV